MSKVINSKYAASLLKNSHTLWIGGSGGGHNVPETLIKALEDCFHTTRSPQSLTIIHAVGIGD
ncbi:hypothetical protein [Peribacillus sp. NPDC058002]|uniref:hypothetical protein n=1 Tax=Peribacillus sp. NPDC058002 TaxID=3346301 RepID=UPI0036DA4D65